MYQGIKTGDLPSKKQQENYNNILELLPIKFAILTLNKMMKCKSAHIQIDKFTSLSCLLKKESERLAVSREIREYLFKHQIMMNLFASWLSNQLSFYYLWKPDPKFGSRCITTKVVPQATLCLSPICINRQGDKKNGDRGSSFFDTDNTNLVKHGQRVKHGTQRYCLNNKIF